ncbi:MAG TPA: DUF493 domain-containing protein [Candidatus Thiothrix moscowensis]|uniref:YbeD family protein n=1 Tax=unclassified Thiothrix TaxID=2636184 RepID=UPI001A1BCBD3|nr:MULTISPECIES: DUF493 domain-containing protein [unclassified Thiothrix]MBJ6611060.1 DUF493 domain-containing protein [Candidatus Thiothrix moscowensis]HRJ53493.1 DUF493 domain-containing protein [Candidatus Thiothrix moscowensis]HRJ93572.1 DUF493 domain-containing protein [Candidatus Thiothrix moscowensis]
MERFGREQELVMEFPCDFPIKVVGHTDVAFQIRICEIVCRHDDSFGEERLQYRHSSSGKYQSLTLNLRATSKEQIDAVYQDLKACELVLWAL